MKRILAITTAFLLLAACGKDENNATNNTNNTSGNNTTGNNTTGNNTSGNNTSGNNTTGNNTTGNNTTGNNTTNTSGTNGTIVACGAVTFEGECSDATTVLFCDDTFGLVEIDCAASFGANATCLVIPEYGADCGVPAGEACEVYDADLDDYLYPFCSGNEAACVWNADASVVCVDDFGTCDEDTFAESCAGDTYIYDCFAGQPSAVDCAALGGTCDAAQGCVMPAGAVCDDFAAVCAAGLTCMIEDTEIVGVCQ